MLSGGVGQFEPRFQGIGVILREYFLVSTKLDTFCYLTVQTAPCYVYSVLTLTPHTKNHLQPFSYHTPTFQRQHTVHCYHYWLIESRCFCIHNLLSAVAQQVGTGLILYSLQVQSMAVLLSRQASYSHRCATVHQAVYNKLVPANGGNTLKPGRK